MANNSELSPPQTTGRPDLVTTRADDSGGIWGSVSRELTLGESAVKGVGQAFADLKDHPGTALAEFGSAALVAGGLALAGRGGIFLSTAARIAETGLAISFGKSLLTSGTAFGAAAVDAWRSPKNMSKDQETVGKISGQFAVDMTAFTLGGIAGSKLAGAIRPGMFSLAGAHDGAVRLSADPAGAGIRTSEVGQTATVQAELASLLSTKDFQQRFSPLNLSTRFGEATISPYYSRESGALNLYLDSPRALAPAWLEIKLNSAGNPSSVSAFNDHTQFLPSLMKEAGLPELAKASGTPTDFALADRMKAIDYMQVNKDFNDLKVSSGAAILVDKPYTGKDALYVFQRTGESSPIATALGTSDIGPCSALIVIDKASGRQFLAHVDHTTNPDLLRDALKSFDLKHSEIYILEGPDNGVASSDSVLGSAQRAFMAVQDTADRVHFLHEDSGSSGASVVIKNGKIYSGAQSYVGY